MGSTALSICQDACRLLGANPPESFTDGTVEADNCQAFYEDTVRAELSTRRWTFATKTESLALLDEDSEVDLPFVFQLPSDLLKAFTTLTPERHIIQGGKLHTRTRDAELTYTFRADESLWPDDFVVAMKYLIAKEISLNITGNTQRTDYFEKQSRKYRNRAAYNDSQQNLNMSVRRSTFIGVRSTGVTGQSGF